MMVYINQDICEGCGMCGYVCPRRIPETIENDTKKTTTISSERFNLCLECGHCVAVCPNLAIQVESLKAEEFESIKALNISENQFRSFLKQRRSIRRYKDKPIPKETIDKIVEAAHTSPTATGRKTTGVIVIDNSEMLAKLSELTYEAYGKLGKALKNPIARFMIRQKKGKQIVKMLQEFIMPGMQWYIRWHKEGKSNEILRDCPALLLFHSPIYEPDGSSNCLIAAFHAILMAQVMNIGTCFNDLIPPMCNRVPDIRKLIGLSDDREVYASITMGYPKYKFKRVIPRKLAEVRYLE